MTTKTVYTNINNEEEKIMNYVMIDSKSYNSLLQQIGELNQKIIDIQNKNSGNKLGEWISFSEVKNITGYGRTSIFNFKKEKKITTSTFGGKKHFYYKPDLIAILEKNKVKKRKFIN